MLATCCLRRAPRPMLWTVVLAVVWCASASPLWANGRYPSAGLIAAHPGDAKTLAVRTTYGLVITRDDGAHWQWLCEDAVNLAGQLDPFVVFGGSGHLVVTSAVGLRTGSLDACTWSGWSPGGTGIVWAGVDIARDPGQPQRLLALISAQGQADRVVQSTDGGQSWQVTGKSLPAGLLSMTLDVATQNGRIYVTARSATVAGEQWLLRSDDQGQTWLPQALAPTPTDAQGKPQPGPKLGLFGTWIGAIDPQNASRLWLRAEAEGADQLWQSEDAGQSWQLRLQVPSKLLGFALSPDGQHIAVGGPGKSGGLWTGPAQPGDLLRVADLGIRCLTWTAGGLLACAEEDKDGFTVGRSTDGGKTFAPLHRRAELTPLACPADSGTHPACAQVWPFVALTLGVDAGSAVAEPPSPPPKAGSSCSAAGSGAAAPWLAMAVLLWGVRYLFRRVDGPRSRRGSPLPSQHP